MQDYLNYILPFLSVIFGFAFVVMLHIKNQRNIKLLLAFSGAFLLAMTIYTLIPEVFHAYSHDDLHNGNGKQIGLWIVVGILLQIVLEFFSQGAEHGHIHTEEKHQTFPWLLFISLSLHAVLEGFPLHQHEHLVYGIFIHHLPVAMVLSVFFLNSGLSFVKTFGFLFLFAMMTPLGTFLAETIPQMAHYQTEISSMVIGIFLHISSVILFEASESHKFNIRKLTAIMLGFVLAYFV